LLLAGVGVGGWWYLTQRTTETVNTPTPVEVSPVTPTELAQSTSSGGAIDAGKTAGSATITLGFTGVTTASNGQLTPEVEIQPLGTAFTNQPNLTGDAVSANGHDMTFKVNTDKLAEGKYHWQARLDKGDQHSDWAIFGGDASAAAFVVDVTAPGTPAVTSIGGKSLANPVVVQSNRTEFKGTSEPNAKISLAIGPDNTTLNAVADASGSWSVAASSDVANGTHEVSVIATDEAGNASQPTKVALSVNPATAADVAPQPAAVTPAVNPQPAQTPTKLANTGDNVMTASLVAALVLLMALAGLMLNRRRYGLN
jgi:LPXTG-motif cell wall-anchored protein